jgi:hypothetical protein
VEEGGVPVGVPYLDTRALFNQHADHLRVARRGVAQWTAVPAVRVGAARQKLAADLVDGDLRELSEVLRVWIAYQLLLPGPTMEQRIERCSPSASARRTSAPYARSRRTVGSEPMARESGVRSAPYIRPVTSLPSGTERHVDLALTFGTFQEELEHLELALVHGELERRDLPVIARHLASQRAPFSTRASTTRKWLKYTAQ